MKLNCLACDQGYLGDVLFKIDDLPLVDSFASTPEGAREIPKYSLELRQCFNCLTIQVASPPDTSNIYQNYIYDSSSSPDLDSHFINYADFVKNLTGTNVELLEIGANDGLLIGHLHKAGFKRITAIDPAPQANTIDASKAKIINDFFSAKIIDQFAPNSFDIIIANNCFSHIPNLLHVFKMCEGLLAKDGVIIIEVQSTLALIEGVIFDYIYHEHYFYHTASSLSKLISKAGLEINKIDLVGTKGGSYRMLITRRGTRGVESCVDYWAYREQLSNIHSSACWSGLRSYLNRVRDEILAMITESPGELYGYGASATGTVLLRYFGLEKHLVAIVDDNPKRQGLYAPGSQLPVIDIKSVPSRRWCLVLAWRHREKIIRRGHAAFEKYIIPLPYPHSTAGEHVNIHG